MVVLETIFNGVLSVNFGSVVVAWMDGFVLVKCKCKKEASK